MKRQPYLSADVHHLSYLTLRHASDPVIWVNDAGKIEHANPAACRRLGYTDRELKDMAIYDLDIHCIESQWQDHFKRHRNREGDFYETAFRTKGGRILPVEVTFAFLEVDGMSYGCYFIRDVSHCKSAELKFRQSEEWLRAIGQALPDLVFVLNEEGQHLEVLTAPENLLHGSIDHILGRRLHDIFPGALAERLLDSIQHTIRTGRSRVIEYELIIDGRPRCFEARTARIDPSFHGKPNVVWVARDITDRKQAEQAVRESEARLQAIGRALPDLVFVVDEEGRYLDVLTTEENLLLADAESLKGRRIHDFLPLHEADGFLNAIVRTIETRQSEILEYQLTVPAGRRWFEARTGPMDLVHEGKRCGVLIARDITDRKLAESLRSKTLYLQEELKRELIYGEIIGKSPALQRVFSYMGVVAGTDATVLLIGETGTGKELVARAIHQTSHRNDEVLIKVNCGALPANLVESELFGHEKGAFTGADSRKRGRFELAHRGTLFLDEVGELPMDMQIKLLRVLQELEFERVGGEETLKVDVRVIAATNKNLEKAVETGRFREDLYYRLNIFPISIPSLRDRMEDIPLLVEYLVDKISLRIGKRIERVNPAVMDLLAQSDWPGNVRELANALERATILAEGETLRGEDLRISTPRGGGPVGPAATEGTMEDIEQEAIRRALDQVGGNRRRAAKKLGIGERTLYDKIKKYGLS